MIKQIIIRSVPEIPARPTAPARARARPRPAVSGARGAPRRLERSVV